MYLIKQETYHFFPVWLQQFNTLYSLFPIMQKGKFHTFLSCLMNCILLLLVCVLGVKDEQENIYLKGVDKAFSYRLCVHTSVWESPDGAMWSWRWKEKQPPTVCYLPPLLRLHWLLSPCQADGGALSSYSPFLAWISTIIMLLCYWDSRNSRDMFYHLLFLASLTH